MASFLKPNLTVDITGPCGNTVFKITHIYIDFSNQIPTAMPSNRARISAARISASNLILSDSTLKNKLIY